MTKLLDQAIARLRELPDAEQDEVAESLFALAAKPGQPIQPDDETRVAIREGLEQAARGDLVSEEEMPEFFRRRGAW